MKPYLFSLALALLFTACSGEDSPKSSPTAGAAEGAPAATAVTTSTAPEATAVIPTLLTTDSTEPPDVIFFNGQVVTIETELPQTQALALSGDTIVAVGNDEEVMALAGPETRLIDLEGRALLPGFVDPHNHVFTTVFHQRDPDLVGTSYAEAQELLIRAGTTTNAIPGIWQDALEDFLPFAESELRIRTSLYYGYNDNCGVQWPEDWYLAYPLITDPDAMLRFPGIKVFSDGGSCGAIALSVGPPGDLFITTEELAAVIIKAQEAGYQVATHAVGDRAIDTVLNALEIALDGRPNTYRHRIEHSRLIRPDQRARYGEIGAIPVVFGQPPACTILDGGGWSGLNVDGSGAAALRPWLDNTRALIDANPGLVVAWKSDAPRLFPLEPLKHLWSLVTRDSQRADGSLCEAPDWLAAGGVTVEEALRMMTINAAYALFMEERIGSLLPGKFADLIILSDNPLTVDADTLYQLEVQMTMIGGKVEHCAAGSEALCPE